MTICARSRAITRRRSTSTCASTPTRARSRRRPRSSSRWSIGCRRSTGTGIRIAAATELRERLGAFLGQPPERLLCGNGSNEVLQTLLLTYGGAGRSALMFEPTYALHAQIARGTATEIVAGERNADFTLDPDGRGNARSSASGRRSCSSAARTTRPARSTPRDGRTRARGGRPLGGRAGRRRRGVRRVRAVERARARRRRHPARRRAHLLEGVVAGGGAARLRGRARRG